MEELNKVENGDSKLSRKKEELELARELSESGEKFPFPGIKSDVYERISADDKEYPGNVTPIDIIIERCKNEGIKVVLGRNNDVYILPFLSDNIIEDSLLPRHLLHNNVTSENLKKLISFDVGHI